MLLAQAALPCALFAPPEFGDVVLDLRGGTDATKAPPVGYMQEVLFPTLERVFGVRVRVERVFRGFYPKVSCRPWDPTSRRPDVPGALM